MEPPDEELFNSKKHVLYWKRCLKTFLPEQYTSMDSNRMMLGFFILSALDLLDALKDNIGADERYGYIDWIYACQNFDGGFLGSPVIRECIDPDKPSAASEPAHVAHTYFALAALAILGDDFGRFNKSKCLDWLTRVQKSDGSFGEQLSETGEPAGAMSMRFNYCASAIRLMVRGKGEATKDVNIDFNVPKLLKRVHSSVTYDGGMSESPSHESHAGFTYCALGTLYCLDQLPPTSHKQRLSHSSSGNIHNHQASTSKTSPRILDTDYIVRWLLFRQTCVVEVAQPNLQETDAEKLKPASDHSHRKPQANQSANAPMHEEHIVAETAAGFNGRCNKVADTCYAFWVGASLAMLGHLNLIDINSCREYLLKKTQHMIGGFGKIPGDPPDIYHSYLGLAALALYGNDGLTSFHPALCMSVRAAARFDALSAKC